MYRPASAKFLDLVVTVTVVALVVAVIWVPIYLAVASLAGWWPW